MKILRVACAVAAGIWIDMLFGTRSPVLVAGVGIAVYVLLGLPGASFGGIWNSGLWTTLPVRRFVGWVADTALWAATLIVSWWLLVDVTGIPARLYGYLIATGDNHTGALTLTVLACGFLMITALKGMPRYKVATGKAVAPLARLVRSRFVGMGGSSSFGGLFNDWAHPHKPGQLLLGASLYDPDWVVGRSDDRHFITIATSRSGKGRSAIIPNLLTWPGSALVIDPKGQNAAVTAAARGNGGGRVKKGMGQSVRIVDPFGELRAQGVEFATHRYNPLTAIDPAALDVVEQIRRLTDALVVPDPSGQADFWDRTSSIVIAGAVAHVLTGETIRPEMRTLYSVRDCLKNLHNASLRESMANNGAAGGLAQVAIATLESLSEKAGGDVIGTALSHTDWLDSLAMKEALAASDFSLSELKTDLATVYLVLPPKYLDEHGRFLRLFVNLALQEASKGRKQRYPILMVLDEFYALGRLQFVAKAAGLLAGYGVTLWPIVQNLGQLAELYPDNWETFLGNAGMWQVFAVNDQTTARYMSERLGEHIVWRKQRSFNQETQKYEEEWVPQGASLLRTGIELGRETSRDSGNQVIFVEGGDSFLLRRRPYDKTFKRKQYSPDPSEPERGWQARFQMPDWEAAYEAWVERKTEKFENWLERRKERKQIAQAPAPVKLPPQPVPVLVNTELAGLSLDQLEAEQERIKAEVKADPRYQDFWNFTPEEKARWDADHKGRMNRVLDIEDELAARATKGQKAAVGERPTTKNPAAAALLQEWEQEWEQALRETQGKA